MSIKKFDYEGKPISFKFSDGNKMINATEMAKPFKKRVNDFLRLNSTKDYILLLERRYADSRNGNSRNGKKETLRIVQGGSPELQGTWMDEKLALKFAAWLSSAFELWVYDRIEELLKTGKTEIPTHRPPSDIISALRLIVDKLEYQERDINELKEGLQEKNKPCTLQMAQEYGRQATAISYQKGMPIGSCHDERYGKVGTYHKDVLKEVI